MAVETAAPHIPVLLDPLLRHVAPVTGRWLDGTFGAGGYTRGLLEAGADHVIAVDQDPMVFEMAQSWVDDYPGRITLTQGNFAALDTYARDLDGVVLDLGVSSMQLDMPERGFSFSQDGPLDMRMGQSGKNAGDIVNTADESALADILYYYGEERASRRIARAIVKARDVEPLSRTAQLARIVEGALPRRKPGQSHPATRSFQALRIAVNDEFGALAEGLMAAERALKPGGRLAVVTFHSLEDRMVKRFLQLAAEGSGQTNRYQPEAAPHAARFTLTPRRAIAADPEECAINPRARSAKLRVATRTDVPAQTIDPKDIGMPQRGSDR